jgi:hypothetical protein
VSRSDLGSWLSTLRVLEDHGQVGRARSFYDYFGRSGRGYLVDMARLSSPLDPTFNVDVLSVLVMLKRVQSEDC